MPSKARATYLETQVLTATPQKLRLMLIEGAIRQARLTQSCWQEGRQEDAFEALVRCRNIVSELYSAVDATAGPLARQVKALYLFLFKTLAEAQLMRDQQKLADALAVLEVEQETWQQFCEQTPDAPPSGLSAPAASEMSSAGLVAILPVRPGPVALRGPHPAASSLPHTNRLSLEG
jgi:flagellar protein FliS